MKDPARFMAATSGGPDPMWHACPRVDRFPGAEGNVTLCGLKANPLEWLYSVKYEITCPACIERMKKPKSSVHPP
ncbi:MAG TPA: hypothetical protein VGQ81_02430 [Acidobacteriota bacterium]|jgi:hypothetical protein|nr:hypothetical protein [Acidobacteriota bacterium]